MGGPRQPALRGLDDTATVAYLAGLIDGEGTIGIYTARGIRSLQPSHYVQVTVVNTATVLMDWLRAEIGGAVDRRKDPGRNPFHKQPYAWRVHGTNADNLLRAVRPFLVIKQAQADLGIALRDLYQPGTLLTDEDVAQRAAIKTQMHALNARGIILLETS